MVLPELRQARWTRLSGGSVLGDQPTENVLDHLAQSTHQAARAQGYSQGWAEGRREAAARAEQEREQDRGAALQAELRRETEHATALATLAAAAASLVEVAARTRAAVETQALGLARELTEALVAHELRVAGELGLDGEDLVRRALASAPTGAPVVLRVPPGTLDPASTDSLDRHGIAVVDDATLEAGDAIAETATSAVDLGTRSALRRVVEALS